MGDYTCVASTAPGVRLKIDNGQTHYDYDYDCGTPSSAPGYTRYYDNNEVSFDPLCSDGGYYYVGNFGPDTGIAGITVQSVPTGYVFLGWYSGASSLTQHAPDDSELTNLLTTSTTLPKSKWSSCSSTNMHPSGRCRYAVAVFTYSSALTFDANGGTGTMSTGKTAVYGQAMPTPIALPTRTGYTFTGFYDAASGGTKYYNADGTSAHNWDKDTTSGTTLYAQWTVNTYTVTFDADGGTVSPATASVTYDAAYGTLPTPTYSGYRFAGWWTATSGGSLVTSSTTVSTAANHTLYALWTEDEILVVLDPQGGSMSGNYFVRATVGSGGTYPALPTPTRGADTFLGWYTAKTGGALVTQGSSLASNDSHTLYAHWSSSAATTHTVSFDANGGTVSEASRSVGEGVAVGATQTLPTPTRTGYTFQGWFAQLKDTSYMGTENISAVAKWQGNPMTITFNVNGGDSLSPSTRTVACGNQYGTLPTPTKSGKVFAGWFTAADNTGTQVTASTVATASVTIYAHWDDAVVVDLDVITFE